MDHEIRLESAAGDSSLSSLINRMRETPQLSRLRRVASLLQGFHLKNTVIEKVSGRQAIINGRAVVNFGSANYLGLEWHPQVLKAASEALGNWGNHSGCSRMFASHANIIELEEQISRLVGSEATMICANTSQTHAGVIPALFGTQNCEIFLDHYAHTSMHQASLIAVAKGAKIIGVDVRNHRELETCLKNSPASVKVLMIDGIYSMQGTTPEIPAIQSICDSTDTILYVDDAHGIGICGENGGGVAEQFGLRFDNMILIGTLQKGLGVYGGFVSGSRALIDVLRISSRSYIFSGTLQPQAVEGALAAIRVCKSAEGRALRERLKLCSVRIRESLEALGFEVQPGDSPIISVLIGSDLRTVMAGRKLYDEGVYVNSVIYPATPRNEGLMRISLNAIHTDEEIAILLKAFTELKLYLATFGSPLNQLSYATEFVARQMGRQIGSAVKWLER